MNLKEEKIYMSKIIAGVKSSGEVIDVPMMTDDDNIPGEETTIVVICLNYVWDSANEEWIRQTA